MPAGRACRPPCCIDLVMAANKDRNQLKWQVLYRKDKTEIVKHNCTCVGKVQMRMLNNLRTKEHMYICEDDCV